MTLGGRSSGAPGWRGVAHPPGMRIAGGNENGKAVGWSHRRFAWRAVGAWRESGVGGRMFLFF